MSWMTSYEGSEPYIFVSYAHMDSDRVLPIIGELQSRGYRVWYDESIMSASEEGADISAHMKNCTLFLVLISGNYLDSEGCKGELRYAQELGKPCLMVYLEEVMLPDEMALRLSWSSLQAIEQYAFDDQERFYEALADADGINVCRVGDGVKLELLTQLAEQGDPAAQYELGGCYGDGCGVPRNDEKAVEWYTRAAEQGHAAAQCQLGACYHYGLGVPENDEKAEEWYTRAAEQGYTAAQCQLGERYYVFGLAHLCGYGVPRDATKAVECLKKAAEWYTRAAEKDDFYIRQANYSLGRCYDALGDLYRRGEGVPKNPEKAAEWYARAVEEYTRAAEQGYALAQQHLGMCYYEGLVVPQDYEKATEWFTRAAEQGDFQAQQQLGVCYYKGRGVPQNYEKAAEWFAKAVENNGDAQGCLAFCYYYGYGVPQDYKKAVELFSRADFRVDAQYGLGECYYYGHGVRRSFRKAVKWYKRAAESYQPDESFLVVDSFCAAAQFRLGRCYEQGHGVFWNNRKAARLYASAAEQGHAGAQYYLGRCYARGRGVSRDDKKAAEWYAKAAEQGDIYV